ncbi:MAG TPA: PHB depolymerase family esterase [Aliidongia sp.]|uniref:extracellular catalytic domain type 1 short-chain-length polyhydroxyalkanoate depolymerase n=1 Tax=Aliidongia sp. TaxID=1914230 RepID=UPI002DDDA168|nr:PHB depolymerase family esterase [Aliidongia sp.]HEV2673077.1 PHB depolymerase family esterase [Aliidongia sp.]
MIIGGALGRWGRWIAFAFLVAIGLATMADAHPADEGDPWPGLMVNGLERHYLLHLPAGWQASAGALPLVIVLHGAAGDARSTADMTGFSPLADRGRFIAVYPEGTSIGVDPPRQTWNAGFCCGAAVRNHVDDLAFLGALIDRLAAEYPVDRRRIYLTGLSNGAMLAYRFAAQFPEKIAAIAPVAGTIGGTAGADQPPISIARPDRPVPVLIIHGMLDGYVLYRGGVSPNIGIPGRFNVSVDDAVRFWAAADGCGARSTRDVTSDGRVIFQAYGDCRDRAEVRLVALALGPHEWPVAIERPGGRTEPTAALIWRFFKQHQR